MPCSWEKATRSGSRAMVPSSFMISQITPAGCNPAMRAMSTAASVCPVRTSTPPSRATSGKTCPGDTMSFGPLVGSIATATVRARSWAEIPVVTPSLASMETVKAVDRGARFSTAIGGSRSWRARSGVMARQIRPRACLAMKLIWSGVANWAGMMMSPSFSRSSASTRMKGRPWRASSMISSTAAIGVSSMVRRFPATGRGSAPACRSRG